MSHSPLTRQAPLLAVPAEIRQVIYSFLITEEELDLSRIRLYRSGDASASDIAPWTLIHFSNLAEASGTLKGELLECVDQYWGHVQAYSADVDKLPEVIEPAGCHLIQRLELCMEGGMLHFPRPNWPRFLDCLVNDMPYLSSLRLYSQWSVEEDEMVIPLEGENWVTVTRRGYHRLRLLRFLSILLLRHSNLDLLIWPSKSQAGWQIEHGMFTECFIAERKLSKSRNWETAVQPMAWSWPEDWGIEYDPPAEMICIRYVEDEILDSRAIRRLLGNEVAEAHLSNFLLKPVNGATKDDVLSSETPEGNPALSDIDRRAYLDKLSPHLDDEIRRYRRKQRCGHGALRPPLEPSHKNRRKSCHRGPLA